MRPNTLCRTIILMVALFSMTASLPLDAQPLSVRASAGFAHLPFPAWSNFWGQIQGSRYQQNNLDLYYALSFHYALSEHHSVNVGTELVRSTASIASPLENALFVGEWRFQGIPVTLGYEYRMTAFNEHFIPVAGAGVSYFFSQVEATHDLSDQTLKRTGRGYGLHGSLGLITEMSQALSMVTQVRYRYSNGMAFTDPEGDIKVEFTGVDFSVGLAWTL